MILNMNRITVNDLKTLGELCVSKQNFPFSFGNTAPIWVGRGLGAGH